MGEIAIGKKNTILKTGSIGSCIVIILYDKENEVGGLAHAMLPNRKVKNNPGQKEAFKVEAPAKYVNDSIDNLVEEIKKMGGKKENLDAKLIGGAKMFKILSGDKYGIGQQNIEKARQKLQETNIPIDSESIGGTTGKIVEFNTSNGIVEVVSKM